MLVSFLFRQKDSDDDDDDDRSVRFYVTVFLERDVSRAIAQRETIAINRRFVRSR